jgi:3-deoxy-D-manno-octulosonic-acid transferase
MVRWMLNFCYGFALLLAAPWLAWKAWTTGKYRTGWGQKLLGLVPARQGGKPCVWLHAVSVGEVNLLGVLIAELRRRHADIEFFISTTTKTGHEIAVKRYAEHTVFYCPLDFSWAVKNAFDRVRPDLFVLAELELWPNLIAEASRRGIPVAIINGRLSDNSFRGYRRLAWLFRPLLRQVSLVAAQSEQSARRFIELGVPADRVTTTGSLKFDGARTQRDNPQTARLRELAGIATDDIVFLAGSTQAPEETYALETFRQLSAMHLRLRLVLVPRHPERFNEVAALLDAAELPWQRRSALEPSPPGRGQGEGGRIAEQPSLIETFPATPSPRVLLVDRMGELADWWGLSHIGFVGGTFGPREGQNMIEPAAYGVATCFGPRTKNFRDVVALLNQARAAVVVQSSEELTAFIQRCLDDPNWAAELGRRAQQLVAGQGGATARTADRLLPLLPAAVPAIKKSAA